MKKIYILIFSIFVSIMSVTGCGLNFSSSNTEKNTDEFATSQTNAVETQTAETGSNSDLPDLAFSGLDIPEYLSISDFPMEIAFYVTNEGDTTAGASKCGIYLDSQQLHMVNIRSLDPGDGYSVSLPLSLPDGLDDGQHQLRILIDTENNVTESDEDNNHASRLINADFTDTALPDLIVKSVTVTPSASASPGDQVNLTITFANVGEGVSEMCGADIALSSGASDLQALGSIGCPSMQPGESDQVYRSVSIPAYIDGGDYNICVRADTFQEITESSETNNLFCKQITITGKTEAVIPEELSKPDLEVSNLNILANGVTASSVNPGASIQVSCTVKNNEDVDTGPVDCGVYLSSNSGQTDRLLGNLPSFMNIGGMASAQGSTLITIPSNIQTGSYYICVKIDSTNGINESNENNNIACKTIIVAEAVKPDFIISSIGFTIGGKPYSTFKSGQLVQAAFSIDNYGDTGSESVSYAVYLSSAEYGTDQILTSGSVIDIGSRASKPVTTSFTVPEGMQTGFYYICIKADFNNKVFEENENNNITCYQVKIEEFGSFADLEVIDVQSDRSPILKQDIVTFSIMVKNRGSQSASGFELRLYLDGELYKYEVWNIALNPGETRIWKAIWVASTAGKYTFKVVLDPGLKITEDNEENNFFNFDVNVEEPL